MQKRLSPEEIQNEAIIRDEEGESIPYDSLEWDEDDLETPIKFKKGLLNKFEYGVLQAAGEQIARLIYDKLGTPDALTVTGDISLDRNPQLDNQVTSFQITLSGKFYFSSHTTVITEDPNKASEDSSQAKLAAADSAENTEIY